MLETYKLCYVNDWCHLGISLSLLIHTLWNHAP